VNASLPDKPALLCVNAVTVTIKKIIKTVIFLDPANWLTLPSYLKLTVSNRGEVVLAVNHFVLKNIVSVSSRVFYADLIANASNVKTVNH